jgi:CheY-like chemotaxis protein
MTKRILVVDDEMDFTRIVTRNLITQGYLVRAAGGVDEVMKSLKAFRPDAILMDVMLPGTDGVKIAEQLARSPATATIPIVFVSALISPYQPQDSPANPLHHYLGKPFEPEVLMGLLRRIGI